MAKQGTLLVVDDNRNILTSLQYLLEEYFQQVITLNSPVTIPSLLQREAIDVVLLDMNFSSGINSGNEGLYWLREIKRLRPQIQVVLFTAYADINLAVTGLKDGATDFIVKPWDNAKLVQTLQEAYAKARGNEKKGSRPHNRRKNQVCTGEIPPSSVRYDCWLRRSARPMPIS